MTRFLKARLKELAQISFLIFGIDVLHHIVKTSTFCLPMSQFLLRLPRILQYFGTPFFNQPLTKNFCQLMFGFIVQAANLLHDFGKISIWGQSPLYCINFSIGTLEVQPCIKLHD